MTDHHVLARALHAVLRRERGGTLSQACTTANNVLRHLRPRAERWIGTFEGQPHEWARLDGVFIDVTAGQFPGGPDLVVATTLDDRWAGQRTEWQPTGMFPPGKLEEVLGIARLVEGEIPSESRAAPEDPESVQDARTGDLRR